MRWVRRILVALLVLSAILGVFGFFLVRRSFPQVEGELSLAGLEESVDIIRDVDGVPHIYASTERDLFFAQGYVHAQDRFWQMDFWRHIGAARLSEMFGDSQLETDMFLRALDFAGIAVQELEALPPQVETILTAYADGVNAYIEDRSPTQISLEYAILPLQSPGYEIEPWSPVNTLTWAKVMSWDLGANLRTEIERAVLSADLPPERIEQLFPAYPDQHPVVVPSDQTPTAQPASPVVPHEAIDALVQAGNSAGAVWDVTGGGFAGIGSNNWVIGGSRTASGLPILANDPHLAIQMPSIWYENGLHCLGSAADCPYQLAGFSFPGTPGVIIGHNENIAWGVTNEALDSQDLFIEKVNPDDPFQYEYLGEWVDMETRIETIEVAGDSPHSYDVMTTRHGPVISGLFVEDEQLDRSSLDLPDEYVVALSWPSLQPSTLVEAIIGLDLATNYDEFRAAASKWDVAAQNLVYADTEGNIAYQATGEVPIRAAGDGRWPVPGWTGEFDWTGVVPFDDLPRLLNPPRDYVASANQPVIPPGSEPFFGLDTDHGHRAARIEEMIELMSSGYTLGDAQTMQMDARDGGAPNLVPHLLALPAEDGAVAAMQGVLRPWATGNTAFQAGGASPGAAAYQAVWVHLLRLLFHDELPEDYWPEGGGRWFEIVRALLEEPDDPWWDIVGTEVLEDRDMILEQALSDAHEELVDRLGANATTWEWGRLHRADFENQTLGQSGIAPIEWMFNRRAPETLGGGADLVNAVGFYPPDGYQVDWIPSMRMVVDLADLAGSTAMNTTGQSGHAFHGHYDDMLERWADGEQHQMRWTAEQVAADAAATLTLTPLTGGG